MIYWMYSENWYLLVVLNNGLNVQWIVIVFFCILLGIAAVFIMYLILGLCYDDCTVLMLCSVFVIGVVDLGLLKFEILPGMFSCCVRYLILLLLFRYDYKLYLCTWFPSFAVFRVTNHVSTRIYYLRCVTLRACVCVCVYVCMGIIPGCPWFTASATCPCDLRCVDGTGRRQCTRRDRPPPAAPDVRRSAVRIVSRYRRPPRRCHTPRRNLGSSPGENG